MRTLPLFVLALVSLSAPAAFAEPWPVLADYTFPNEWITPQQWPPVGEVLSVDEEPECDAGTTMNGATTHDNDVLGWSACVTTAGDGAAGSTYHTYAYKLYREKTGTAVSIEWSLRQVQCANYDEPMRAECERGQDAFWREYNPKDVVEASLLAMLFVPGHDCRPYQCADGTAIGSCDKHGRITNFVEPCGDHGGVKNPFMDVSYEDEPFLAEAIAYVKAEGIVEGYADGTYRPDQTINRAEFTKIVIGALADKESIDACLEGDSYRRFRDIPVGAWYDKYVCQARNSGVVGGYADGTFGPDLDISFAEASAILYRAFYENQYFAKYAVDPGIVPLSDGVWYEKPIRQMEIAHAIPHSVASHYAPITRGEMAHMIYVLRANITNMLSQTYEDLMR